MISIKFFKYIASFLAILMVVVSCTNKKNRSTLPRSIGNTSEVLVVIQDKNQWNNEVGETLKKYLEDYQYGLPQQEHLFKLANVLQSGFSELFQKHHSILIVNVDKKLKTAKIEKSVDKWAKPQVIYKISAPDNQTFAITFKKSKDEIIKGLNKVERERIMNVFNAAADINVMQKFADKFKLKIVLPEGFYVAKNEPGFMWLKWDLNKHNLGIIAISVPYKDTLQFKNKSIASRIMLFMKNYIPGPTEGSYMTLDTVFVRPVSRHVDDYFVPYTIETRGMWRVEHDFMAGPFVAYTFINPKTNEIVTLLGYVYKPNKEKRNLLRQIEAILYSTKPYKEKENP